MKRALLSFLVLLLPLLCSAAPNIQGRPTPTIYQSLGNSTNASPATLARFLQAYWAMEDGAGNDKIDATGHNFTLIPRATFPDNQVSGIIGFADNAGAAGAGGGFQAAALNNWDSGNNYPGSAAGNSGVGSGKDFTINLWYNPDAGMTVGGVVAGESATYAVLVSDATHVKVSFVGEVSPAKTVVSSDIPLDIAGAYLMLTFGWDHRLGIAGSLWTMTNGTGYTVYDANTQGNPFGCLHSLSKFTLLNYENYALGPCNQTTVQGIDEIGVWTRKLNTNEVLLLYNSGAATRPSGLNFFPTVSIQGGITRVIGHGGGNVYVSFDGSVPNLTSVTPVSSAPAGASPPAGTWLYDGSFALPWSCTLKATEGGGALVTSTQLLSIGETWSNNVTANGGAAPAAATCIAINTFGAGLNNDQLLNQSIGSVPSIPCLNTIAPDSLIAATTPQIYYFGVNPWINNSFVGGDLTVDGLAGNGSFKYFDIGAKDSVIWASGINSIGISFYAFSAPNETAYAGSQITADLTTGALLRINSGGNARFDSYDGGITAANIGAGFYSGNRTAANATALYAANTGNAFAAIATGAGATTHSFRNSGNIYAYALGNGGTPVGGLFSSDRFSFIAMHNGFSSAKVLKLYNRVVTLRTAYGGGLN